MELPDHVQNRRIRIHIMRGPHKSLVHPRHRQRLQLMPALPFGQGAELVGQVGKQQRAKGGVRGNQVADGLPRQLVRHHFFCRHEAAADLASHQPPAVETVVRAVGSRHVLVVELLDKALDDDEQVGGLRARRQNGGALGEIGNVHAALHLLLLLDRQAVKRGSQEIEGTWHGERPKLLGSANFPTGELAIY